jgi:flagellar basal-body rod protein FlgC
MIMISGIGASTSALTAFADKLSNAAGNIANANTDGYKATVANITANEANLPQIAASTSDTPGALVQRDGVLTETSNVDLSREIPQMGIAGYGYKANIKALEAEGEMLRSTLDILA